MFFFFFFSYKELIFFFFFFFQAEDGIRDYKVTGVQTCALPICGLEYPCQHMDAGAQGRAGLQLALKSGGKRRSGRPAVAAGRWACNCSTSRPARRATSAS